MFRAWGANGGANATYCHCCLNVIFFEPGCESLNYIQSPKEAWNLIRGACRLLSILSFDSGLAGDGKYLQTKSPASFYIPLYPYMGGRYGPYSFEKMLLRGMHEEAHPKHR